MPYEPVEDIPGIEKLSVDSRVLNRLMQETITTTRIALKHHYNVKKGPDYRDELCQYLRNQLQIFSITHNSINVLIRYTIRKRYYPTVVDAASLGREQIEKVFSFALVLSNPHKWIKQYLRGAWRNEYEAYLLTLEEHGENPRYQEFLRDRYITHLTEAQRPPLRGRRPETIVSNFARRALTHYWNNPVGKNPPWFKRKQGLRQYLSEYFEFPTPGKSVKYIKYNRQLRRFLFRWHKEYSYFSEFTHVGSGKSVLPFMSESRNVKAVKRVETYGRKLMERIIFTSFTATASSCTLILPYLVNSYGARNYLKELWETLYGSSLLSRAFWNIYPKSILS